MLQEHKRFGLRVLADRTSKSLLFAFRIGIVLFLSLHNSEISVAQIPPPSTVPIIVGNSPSELSSIISAEPAVYKFGVNEYFGRWEFRTNPPSEFVKAMLRFCRINARESNKAQQCTSTKELGPEFVQKRTSQVILQSDFVAQLGVSQPHNPAHRPKVQSAVWVFNSDTNRLAVCRAFWDATIRDVDESRAANRPIDLSKKIWQVECAFKTMSAFPKARVWRFASIGLAGHVWLAHGEIGVQGGPYLCRRAFAGSLDTIDCP